MDKPNTNFDIFDVNIPLHEETLRVVFKDMLELDRPGLEDFTDKETCRATLRTLLDRIYNTFVRTYNEWTEDEYIKQEKLERLK